MARTKYSFWSDGLDEEYYIIKQKKGSEKLTEINVLHDHIANSIYQLFGVCTPNLYIGYYQKQLSLISSVLPGYKDLIEWFSDENVLEEINQCQNVEACIAAYKKFESELSIHGKESLLAAAIILDDSDVLGVELRNIGLIQSNGLQQIIKIDPSDSIFTTTPKNIDAMLSEFEDNLSLEAPLIYNLFSFTRLYNNPKSIVGNLHLSEFFHDIDKELLKYELAKFASFNDAFIKKMIIRDEYLELLSFENKELYLEHLANVLLRKKNVLKERLNLPQIQVILPELAPVFIKDIVLSEPLEHIEHGASHPFKVKKTIPSKVLLSVTDHTPLAL
jgi:hypothetical protein